MSDFETIKLEVKNQIAIITLNRPQRLNAAPPRMFAEIHIAVSQLEHYGARALVLTGEGRAFCSGADIAEDGDQGDHNEISAGETSRKLLKKVYNPCLQALSELPIPVVSAVNGLAAGIGVGLALSADFCLAARSAYFLQAFVNIGLVPDGGCSWVLPRLIGVQRAKELMMLGERLPSATAQDWGMIYRCVDDEQLLAEALVLGERLAKGPAVALGQMRQAINEGLHLSYAQGLANEAEHQRIAGNSNDSVEGVVAFTERRPAMFSGS